MMPGLSWDLSALTYEVPAVFERPLRTLRNELSGQRVLEQSETSKVFIPTLHATPEGSDIWKNPAANQRQSEADSHFTQLSSAADLYL